MRLGRCDGCSDATGARRTALWPARASSRASDYGKTGESELRKREERSPSIRGSFPLEKGLLLKRAFMSITAAAIALGFAGSVTAAPTAQQTSKASSKTGSTKKPKLSKWQQHVLEVLKEAAPGDEYFGRMKMSYLGINNTFHDDTIRAGSYTTDPHLISAVSFADEALNAWAKKYPNDPQLARSYFLGFLMYRKVWTPDGQQKAWDYAHIVIRKWPSSYFGKALKKDLSVGFTEHYFATPVPCQSLVLTGSADPSATPSPTPMPTPTPAPGQPKIDVLPVPCITPSPSPSPLPTGSLAPSPGASPAPAASVPAVPSPAPASTRRP